MAKYNEESGFISELHDLLDDKGFSLELEEVPNRKGEYFAEITNYEVNHMEWTERLFVEDGTLGSLISALEERVANFSPEDEASNYYDANIVVMDENYTETQCFDDMCNEKAVLNDFLEGLNKISPNPDGIYLSKEIARKEKNTEYER